MNTLPTCVIKYLFEFLPTKAKGRFRQTCRRYSKLSMSKEMLKRTLVLTKILQELACEYKSLRDINNHIICSSCPRSCLRSDPEFTECNGCNREYCNGCTDVLIYQNNCLICLNTKCENCGKEPIKAVCFVCSKAVCCGKLFYWGFTCSKCLN